MTMEVKLIAMTGLLSPDLTQVGVGGVGGAEILCDHAARTCVSAEPGEIPGADGDGVPSSELRSLRQTVSSHHDSVTEHASYTFQIEGVSRALLAQLSRHRLMSLSVQSQRYVSFTDGNFDYVLPESIRDNEDAWADYSGLMESIDEYYNVLVNDHNIPPEDARMILPNACTTNIILTANARELKHIFLMRCCNRAQAEIRELAERMLEQCRKVSPVLFADAGPSCVRYGSCPEGKRSCGRCRE